MMTKQVRWAEISQEVDPMPSVISGAIPIDGC